MQSQFEKSLYTGIKNERIRQELKPLLKSTSRKKKKPSDKQIIAEITEICMVDMEHQAKIEAKTRRGNVSAIAVETTVRNRVRRYQEIVTVEADQGIKS